jgi:hypothetical protein
MASDVVYPTPQLKGEISRRSTRARARGWSETLALSIILLVALGQGLLYLFLLPPWQKYDEPTHFEYAWLIANWGRLPRPGDRDQTMRREVAASMVEHDFYRGLPAPDLLTDDRNIEIGYSELGHPPAYYLLVSIPLRLVRHLDVVTQMYVGRAVSLVLFLLTILVAIALARDLAPPGHPLRWALPLALVLLAPFVNQMTSINNDVGAALVFSLFLWVTVRTILFGLSFRRILALLGAASLAVVTKSTAALAFVFIPLIVIIALWNQRRWRWRWFWLPLAAVIVAGVALVFDWGDAAYWYRSERHHAQLSPTRVQRADAPWGSHAIHIEVDPADRNRRLLNPLAHDEVRELAGQVVTVGGWLWAEQEARVLAPGLVLSPVGTTLLQPLTEPVTIATTPTFVAHTFEVPETTGTAYYALFTGPGTAGGTTQEPLDLYLDGAFLVVGELPAGVEPQIEGQSLVVGETMLRNFVRNPEGAAAWPRVRPWINQALARYGERNPAYVLAALTDIGRSGPFLAGTILPYLVRDFFGAFAWGHVRLEGGIWNALMVGLVIGALAGNVKWLAQSRAGHARTIRSALLLLGLVALLIWGLALIWPLPYPWARITWPSARYAHPVIIPTLLFLVGGWWALWPRRARLLGMLALLLCLLVMNVAAIITISSYYQPLGPGMQP